MSSSERVSLLDRPTLPEIPAAARVEAGPRSVAVVDLLPGSPLAPSITSIVAASGGSVTRLRARLRTRPGHELATSDGALEVTAHPEALVDAARAALAAAPKGTLLVLEGAGLFAATTPALAILGAASPSLASLPPDVRGVRERFDLVLYGERPGALRRLIEALLGS